MNIILENILVLSAVALLAAFVLYFVSQKFSVQENPLTDKITALLPGVNCGACGKAGCRDFASACCHADEKTFASLYCPVGGSEVMKKVADELGFAATEQQKKVATLKCNGSCENAPAKICYDGAPICRIADKIFVGSNGCPNGCLKLGDCVKVCKFDALQINPQTGLPEVDETKCTACGACVNVCPRGLFELRPISADGQKVYVACSNTQKGAVARKNCKAACIGCMKCTKINSEIKVANNLSYIPSSVSPKEYGAALAATCPTGAIIYTGNKAHEQ